MFHINQNELVDLFKKLVRIPSPSKKEKEVADFVKDFLLQYGCDIYEHHNQERYGGNCPTIFAHLKGNIKGEGITLSAHLDVVEPNQGVQIIEQGDILKTDGTTTLGGDDKAGVAVILYVIKYLVEQGLDHEDVYCVFTPGEEVGMLGARHIDWGEVKKHILPAKDMIVLDNAGPSRFIAYQAPTAVHYRLEVHGKKAHAGIEPEKGISAVQLISHIIAKWPLLRIDQTTTANVSVLRADGPTNVVPDKAFCEGELRAHSVEKRDQLIKDYQKICDQVCQQYGGTYEFVVEESYPLLSSKDNKALATRFQKVYRKIGIESTLQIIGGGSDANFFAEEGFNAIIIGVGMEKVHTTEEYLCVPEMITAAQVLLCFLNDK